MARCMHASPYTAAVWPLIGAEMSPDRGEYTGGLERSVTVPNGRTGEVAMTLSAHRMGP